jgi:virginiamycin B lyase
MAVSFRIPALVACTVLLAACAGGRGTGAFAPAALPQSDAAFEPAGKTPTVAMKYSIKIPPVKPGASEARRHEQFVSASTQSIAFAVYNAGKTHTAKNLLFTKVIALNAGAKGCTSAKTRTCTGTLNLPPPAVDIVATTYDLKPAGKKVSKKAKKLGVATIANLAVKANKKIPLALGGIPVSFTMTIAGATDVNGVPTSTVYGMSASTTALDIDALDADGNVILTDGYVNAAGASTGIALSVTASQPTCGTNQVANGGEAASKIVVSAPSDEVHFSYGAPSIAAAFSTAGYCKFTLAAKFGALKSGGLFVLDGPQLNEYAVGPANSEPNTIAVGPDNNIWFVDLAGSVGTINVSTKAVSEYPLGAASGIVSHGGKLYVSTYNSIVTVQSNGAMTSVPTTTTGAPADQLAVDTSGNFWFSETQAQRVAKITPAGVTAEFPVTGSPYPVGMTAGSDGNMWFDGCIGNVLVKITPNAPNTQTRYAVPDISQGDVVDPFMMISGPDGNLWFTSCAAGLIGRTALPAGSTIRPTYFQAPSTGRAQLWGLAPGPNGDMWMADIQGYLDRMPLTSNDATQITQVKVSQGPKWMTTGPDGAIWFTEYVLGSGGGKIGRLVP